MSLYRRAGFYVVRTRRPGIIGRIPAWLAPVAAGLSLVSLTMLGYNPWSEAVAADPDPTPAVASAPVQVTLREFSEQSGMTVTTLRTRRDRDASFPRPTGQRGQAALYSLAEREEWFAQQG